jgi:4-amino-4-deoxy-L-arabinose transferase-like glycosyltransferase
MRPLRALVLVLAGWALVCLGWAVARRVPYPYDLEWMEGGMLCHALQVDQGRPLYGPPSVSFVSFAYTPLYPMVVAELGRLFGLGYTLARSISVLAFGAALILAYAFVRSQGGRPIIALATLAVPAAAFAPTGAWYDLARIDSLSLALATAGSLIGWWQRRSRAGVALAGALLVAAFFTKQTAALFIVALGLGLLLAEPRVLAAYVAGVGVPAALSLWWLDRSSGGWFWLYAFGLHQRHPFNPVLAAVSTPARLLLLIGPGLALIPWSLSRSPCAGLVYAIGLAAAGLAASCLGAGTEWSYHNALIPGLFFGALAMGVSASRLLSDPRRHHRTEAAVLLLLAGSIASAPGGLVALVARALPSGARPQLELPLGYDLRAYVPSAADRAAGDALIARLRATPGEVFVPYHSFYGHLAGKRTYLHAMNLADLQRAGIGPPRDLVEAIRTRAFALVVLDLEQEGPAELEPAVAARREEDTLGEFPRLLGNYRLAERISGPRPFSGGAFRPCCLAVPRPP